MESITFKININAPKNIVWIALWHPTNYPIWTSVFGEGNTAVSSWLEGSSITFLSADGGGLYSIIEKLQVPHQVIFKHLGEIKNGEKINTNWQEAREQYYLTDNNNTTVLEVVMDTKPEYNQYFNLVFPKALKIVKQIAERI